MTVTIDDRAIATSDDREAWLRARRAGVTATEIAKLERGGVAFATIAREKRSGIQTFTGNRYTEYGKLREPKIGKWVQERFDIAPSSVLYYAVENPRHLATPDGVGRDFDGNLVLSEIKTSKHDLSTIPRDYYVQILWQQYVLGAQRTLFVWEQHDDDWPDPQPLRPEPLFQWVERDDEEITRLITIADRFLLELEADPSDEPDYNLALDELAQEVLVRREAESVEKKAKESAWKQLQARVADVGNFSQVSPVARVTYSVTSTPGEEPDEEAARAANPELAGRYDAVVAEFRALVDAHKKKVVKTSKTLTVTAVKKGERNA